MLCATFCSMKESKNKTNLQIWPIERLQYGAKNYCRATNFCAMKQQCRALSNPLQNYKFANVLPRLWVISSFSEVAPIISREQSTVTKFSLTFWMPTLIYKFTICSLGLLLDSPNIFPIYQNRVLDFLLWCLIKRNATRVLHFAC